MAAHAGQPVHPHSSPSIDSAGDAQNPAKLVLTSNPTNAQPASADITCCPQRATMCVLMAPSYRVVRVRSALRGVGLARGLVRIVCPVIQACICTSRPASPTAPHPQHSTTPINNNASHASLSANPAYPLASSAQPALHRLTTSTW